MRETRIVEFKETITNTFLKTVSAFSNYNGGTILFGVDDNGNVKGLPDVKQACLDIENKINDSISPQPNYTLEIQNNDQTIKLTVKSGLQKPYLYKSKAYKRNDTATIEVDTLEFSRLVLDGKNISFEELPCKDQELSFKILQCKLKENIYIETFNQDTLKTLNLYDNINGYNNAAGLLADKNHFSGIDIVKFGENISIIQKRVTFEHISVLEIYEKALAVFRDYYQYEEIQGADRKKIVKIPEAACRETIANALIFLFGGLKVLKGELSIGEFTIITTYFKMMLSVISYYLNIGKSFQDSKSSFERIQELLNISEELNGEVFLENIDKIELKDITFKYGDNPILSNFNYSLKKGKNITMLTLNKLCNILECTPNDIVSFK